MNCGAKLSDDEKKKPEKKKPIPKTMEERAAARTGPRRTYKPESELSKKEKMQKAQEEAKEYEEKMEKAWGQFGRIQDRMKAREAKRKKKPSAYAEKKMEVNREEEVKKVYVNHIRALLRKHNKEIEEP